MHSIGQVLSCHNDTSVDYFKRIILFGRKKGLLKKSLSNVASAFRHWLQKKYKERLQPVEVAAVL